MPQIIDFHTHLGDIFHENKNITFKTNIKKGNYQDPFLETEESGYSRPLIIDDEEDLRQLIEAGQKRSWEWTLENMSHEMDKADITYAVVLPVWPNTTFEEYLAASKLDSRLIVFSTIDYSLDEKQLTDKLQHDIKRGAKGLKLNPTLQNRSMDHPLTETAIRVFGDADLPIISHVGTNPYYTPDKPFETNPQFSKVECFVEMAHKFPNYKMVAAHCCTFIEEFAPMVKNLDNVYTDTTMCSANMMKNGVKLLGEDKILFGSDAPFGRIDYSVQEMAKAFADEPEIAKKTFYNNAARLMNMTLIS
ncbi:amidohydrolase family protein [Vagococcus acidifermentans]|uniref:Amidohydrolase-related domain-containing protein n=1 Tax=Vagococcus acidifermentans TaxID=564710 RepID=A0A430ANM3_9ENTE|nr:amidohydrolase family protein [Vagococcus acidifermentans]RSU09665.1 hypothetical protein CBF27_12315 [Vagococcus acidifermentans]